MRKKTDEQGAKASKGQGTLLWLRMDLRLHDQPALDAAAKRASTLGGPLAFCFLQSLEEDGDTLHEGQTTRARVCMNRSQQSAITTLPFSMKEFIDHEDKQSSKSIND